MFTVNLGILTEFLHLAETLQQGRSRMFAPQDLPGRFGRVIRDLDHVLLATDCDSALGGGWAVWRHGYLGRMTEDVDILLPKNKVDEFLRVAALGGFQVLEVAEGRWPKMIHRETGIQVDILPEGGRPGTNAQPAPTTIRAPGEMGASGPQLRYVTLAALIELKLAAGRTRDYNDVIELIRANDAEKEAIALRLAAIHPHYAAQFARLVREAAQQVDHEGERWPGDLANCFSPIFRARRLVCARGRPCSRR